jgi:hypothetical protein
MSNNTDNINTITLDDLTYFWMPNGAPCFIANNYDIVDDFCETVESFGFQIYYIITDKETSRTVQVKNDKGVNVPTEVYDYTPAVLKVVNNFTGRAIMDSPDAFGNSFAPVQETAEYKMPPIPRIIVDKLDEFFRLVDAQHHTESIVILTYDTTKEGSEGWGVLVPEQTNTSVHCKYDADSIASLKPDHVMIVGSVHSHPDMPAYASGTDHADQADFDGVHITYGWQKSVNGGATQYHIELQIGGSNYTLKPEDVFETFTLTKDPDPEVVQWSTKVKKVLPPSTGVSGTQVAQRTQYQTQTQATHSSRPTVPGTTSFDRKAFLGAVDSVDPDSIIAIEIDDRTNPNCDCLICFFPLTAADLNSGFCMTCDTPIITPNMGQSDIIEYLHLYCEQRQLDPTVAYYVYCTDESNTGSDFLINIKPKGQHPKELGSEANSIESDYTSISYEYTLCCNLPLTMADTCTCPKTVYEDDIIKFDNAHSGFDVYDTDASCYDCQNYYQVTCPAFRKGIVDFVTDGTMVTKTFGLCDAFVNYKDKHDTLTFNTYGDYYV